MEHTPTPSPHGLSASSCPPHSTYYTPCTWMALCTMQVADQLGDKVKILKIDVDENPELSSQLRVSQ